MLSLKSSAKVLMGHSGHPLELLRAARTEFCMPILIVGLLNRIVPVRAEDNVMRIAALFGLNAFAVTAALVASALFSVPALSDPLLKREPLLLPPYISVLVDTGTCRAGMVMKVRGAIPGRSRQRTCVPMGTTQARNSNML